MISEANTRSKRKVEMKKCKWYWIILLSLGLVWAGCIVNCTVPHQGTEFITYRSDNWGYEISYPKGWEIEEEEQQVNLIPSPMRCIGQVSIFVYEGLTLPAEMAAQSWINTASEGWGNLNVQDSRAMHNGWDWYLLCDYTWQKKGIEFKSEVYFKQAGTCLYEVESNFEKACYHDYPLSEMVGTFRLPTSTSTPSFDVDADYLHYENFKYRYCIDYPYNWILDTEEPDSVELSPALPECFAVINITTRQSEESSFYPVDEIAMRYLKAASDVFESLMVEHSGKPEASQWDWLVIYSYLLLDIEMTDAIYFKLTPDILYEFCLTWETEQGGNLDEYSYDYEMLRILDSFRLTT